MNSIDKLTELFKSLPGIGPRQARRFVYYILSRNGSYSDDLVRAIEELKRGIHQCDKCQRYFVKNGSPANTCKICLDETRDNSLLMVVPRDVDLEVVEKSGSYEGHYFVLGGVVPILDKEPERRIRLQLLASRLEEGAKAGLKEVILAMNVNMDGEHTADFIKGYFKDLPVTFSLLGRGLSNGAELEYADPETLKNALRNRTK